jgi:LuxR family transcriptional regulator, maltose regulon positive regulatory protein
MEYSRAGEETMPKPLIHALIWSHEHKHYTLYSHGQPERDFLPEDQSAFAHWLDEHATFAFEGQAGRISVLKETRSRGSGYWYAYRTHQRRTRKRYLGRTQALSLAHLEEAARMLWPEQQPARATSQGIALLSSKLSPPRLPTTLVERERLLAALDEALATRLCLLSAQAGFGKTTLLATWASRRKSQIAWLSLDELDTTPTRFWVTLIAALRHCPSFPTSFGAGPMALLQSPQPPPLSTVLTALLQELESGEGHAAPIVLIVDDYQVIGDPTIHEGMRFFLEHLPAHVHLILSCRVDPELPLARLRVRGHLTEIRADELRFAEGEANQYLGQLLSPALEADEVRRLVSRTEGWIAGLHLAALTLQKRADRAAYFEELTGSQRYLLDYVQEEILARLPEHVRDFLLHSAILSHLDTTACQAVTAAPTRAASQQMLVFLERANLFVVPLDEERRSYRLHDLFREALLSVLHTTQPELVPLLHQRAAAFYEAQEQWYEAIPHALAAADYSMAARLMEQTVEQFWLRGEAETIAHWVLALPQPLVHEHARLLLTTALYLLNMVTQTTREQRARVYQQAQQLMAQVESALPFRVDEYSHLTIATRTGTGAVLPPEARRAGLYQRLCLLHAEMAWYEAMATWEDGHLSTLYQEIQELDQDEEIIWQIFPLLCRFLLHYWDRQEGAVLVPQLLSAKQRASQSTSLYAITRVREWLALSQVEAGHLRLAYQESLDTLDLVEQIAGYAPLKGFLQICLALVCYQWNRLEEAHSLLATIVQDATAWPHLNVLGMGYACLIQVELARGEWSLAELALHELEQLVERERYWTYSDWLLMLRAQWWLAQGQLKEAFDWASGVLFPEGSWDRNLYDAFPVVIRVYFAKLRFREALNLLERWSGHLDRPANVRITMTYLAQLLVALHQAGQHKRVHEIAERLFALTEPEGCLRVYLDEGEPMKEALQALFSPHSQQHKWAISPTASIAKLLAAFEQEQSGASRSREGAITYKPALSSARQPSIISSAPGISFTRREQEVLRLLATGASNQDIAQTLVISLDTVKKHVSHLLGKLGASSRTQAVALARAHSLF